MGRAGTTTATKWVICSFILKRVERTHIHDGAWTGVVRAVPFLHCVQVDTGGRSLMRRSLGEPSYGVDTDKLSIMIII